MNFALAHSSCRKTRPMRGEAAFVGRINSTRAPVTVAIPSPLVFHLLVGFRWRRIRGWRNDGARRQNCFGLGVACDGR
jgi:hypothetical protein